jgi:hypothetical protein
VRGAIEQWSPFPGSPSKQGAAPPTLHHSSCCHPSFPPYRSNLGTVLPVSLSPCLTRYFFQLTPHLRILPSSYFLGKSLCFLLPPPRNSSSATPYLPPLHTSGLRSADASAQCPPPTARRRLLADSPRNPPIEPWHEEPCPGSNTLAFPDASLLSKTATSTTRSTLSTMMTITKPPAHPRLSEGHPP